MRIFERIQDWLFFYNIFVNKIINFYKYRIYLPTNVNNDKDASVCSQR